MNPIQTAIEAGRPLTEVATYFPDQVEALEYFANYMEGRPRSLADGGCELCGQKRAVDEHRCTWKGKGRRMLSLPRIFIETLWAIGAGNASTDTHEWLRFHTRHAICPPCAQRTRFRRGLAEVIHYVLFAVLIALVIGGMGILLGNILMLCLGAFRWFVPMLLLGAVLGLWGCAAGFAYCRKMAVPPKLQEIGRAPFTLEKIEQVG